MLRESVETFGYELRPGELLDGEDPGLPFGRQVVAYVDVVMARQDPAAAAEELAEAVGIDGLLAVAGVIANFEMMNRIADATGMPVGPGTMKRTGEWRASLGIDRFRH